MQITMITLILAIMSVESGGERFPNQAIGDGGASVGCLQIGKAIVDDVNRVTGSDYTYADRNDRQKSIAICEAYLVYWGDYYHRQTGKRPTAETYSKLWNGGALAWKKTNPKVVSNLDHYWSKVYKQLTKGIK